MTRNGIEYDLPLSPYVVYEENTHFYFSSIMYKNKFLKIISTKKENIIRDLIQCKFSVNFQCALLTLVVLYMRIEKRGFFISSEGVSYNCPENLILDGEGRIVPNFRRL